MPSTFQNFFFNSDIPALLTSVDTVLSIHNDGNVDLYDYESCKGRSVV